MPITSAIGDAGTNDMKSVTSGPIQGADTIREVVRPSTLFLIATAFGISSTAQAFWLGGVDIIPRDLLHLLALNLTYWYVPALLAPVIMRLALRYRLGRMPWLRVVLVHVAAAIGYSWANMLTMVVAQLLVTRVDLAHAHLWAMARRLYFSQLDWMLMTYLFLVGVANALAYRRESEARALKTAQLEARMIEAQLRALQNELRPHFLFNTLNTISGLMRTDIELADAMIDRLGDLLRMTLHTAKIHPLHRELAIARKYLDIEQTRFGDRLSVDMDIAADTLDALVPSLLLQPLVENAVRHGVVPYTRPGRVGVRASRVGPHLVFHLSDSGDGAPPERLMALNKGVGLANTRARLTHLYADAFTLEFSNNKGGFLVTIAIPFRTERDAVALPGETEGLMEPVETVA
jgi:two-component system LytT family sensor kinase